MDQIFCVPTTSWYPNHGYGLTVILCSVKIVLVWDGRGFLRGVLSGWDGVDLVCQAVGLR